MLTYLPSIHQTFLESNKKKSIFGGKIKQNNEVLNGAEYIQAVNSAIGWKTLVS